MSKSDIKDLCLNMEGMTTVNIYSIKWRILLRVAPIRPVEVMHITPHCEHSNTSHYTVNTVTKKKHNAGASKEDHLFLRCLGGRARGCVGM